MPEPLPGCPSSDKPINCWSQSLRCDDSDEWLTFGADWIEDQRLVFQTLYEEYIYRNRLPDIKELLAVLSVRPKVSARKAVAELVREKMEELAAVYESSEI